MQVRIEEFNLRRCLRRPAEHVPPAGREEEHRPAQPDRSGPAGYAAGSDQAAADPAEPAVQRDQVHAGGRPGAAAGDGPTSPMCASSSPTPAWASPRRSRSWCSRSSAKSGNPLTREHAGTGLGLSIVRELSQAARRRGESAERTGPGQHVHGPAASRNQERRA